MSEASSVVSARGVSRVFNSDAGPVVALQNFSINALPSQLITLTGRSGSGKSTALDVLSGVVTPTTGTVILCGEQLEKLNSSERTALRSRTVGRIFQHFELFEELSCVENVQIALELRGVERRQSRNIAEKHLTSLGLASRLDAACVTLSGGEKQRTAIARALACEPKVLLADEPTGNLDRVNALSVIRAFREIADRGYTVIVATHDPLFDSVADTTIVVSND